MKILLSIARVMPVLTATVERSFSDMKKNHLCKWTSAVFIDDMELQIPITTI